eukprot:COSAG06_NODE_31918_length_514_cov_0.585542_2_plen_63_part_00
MSIAVPPRPVAEDYGYGAKGLAPTIPGRADLEFELELEGWEALAQTVEEEDNPLAGRFAGPE